MDGEKMEDAKAGRQEKHTAIIYAINSLDKVIDKSISLAARIRGEPPINETSAKVSSNDSLNGFLNDYPGIIKNMTERLDTALSEIRELIF